MYAASCTLHISLREWLRVWLRKTLGDVFLMGVWLSEREIKTDRSELGESFNRTTKIWIFFYNSDKENPNRNQYLVLRENVYMSRFDFWGWKKSRNSNFLKYFSQEKINCEKFAIKIKAWMLFHNCCSHSCLISIGIELQAEQSFQ